MTKDDPRVKEHQRRVDECKTKMIAAGIYMRSFSLNHTNVQDTWRRYGWVAPFGTPESPPALEAAITSSPSGRSNAKSARGTA